MMKIINSKVSKLQFLENYLVWKLSNKKYGILQMHVSVDFFRED